MQCEGTLHVTFFNQLLHSFFSFFPCHFLRSAKKKGMMKMKPFSYFPARGNSLSMPLGHVTSSAFCGKNQLCATVWSSNLFSMMHVKGLQDSSPFALAKHCSTAVKQEHRRISRLERPRHLAV